MPTVADGVDPSWAVVKRNPSRTVYRREIDGQTVYLKHYHNRSWTHRLRRRFGNSDALREMRFAAYLAEHGIETADVLAARFDEHMEWLVTRAVAPAEPLDQWHLRQLTRGVQGQKQIRRMTSALGRLVGRLHACGVIHHDLHSGNLFIRTDGPGMRLVLMDLHRIALHRRARRATRAANIAQLMYDRLDVTTRTDRLRFLAAYLDAAGAEGSLAGWVWLIEGAAWRHMKRQYRQRDSRVFKNNRYFSRIRLPGGWRGHVVLASKRQLGGSEVARHILDRDDWKALLADPLALLDGEDVELIKDSPTSRIVRRRITMGDRSYDVFIKQPRARNTWKWFCAAWRSSRPLKGFALGHALLTRRIATALPMAALERRSACFLRESILITEAVDAPHLYDFMSAWLSSPPKRNTGLTVPQQRQLAQDVLWQLGRMVQKLHDNNFAHRDLKATNIRVRWQPGTSPEIVLIDLDGLAQVRFMTLRRKYRGLMRLNVSLLQCPAVNHAGRLRMLLGYLRRPGAGTINFKPTWRLLEYWSARKLRQQIRSRRRRQKAQRGS